MQLLLFFYFSLGKHSNFVLGISSAVGCLRLSLSNLLRVIFSAKVITEMSLKCNIFSPFKAKSDPTNASGSEKHMGEDLMLSQYSCVVVTVGFNGISATPFSIQCAVTVTNQNSENNKNS